MLKATISCIGKFFCKTCTLISLLIPKSPIRRLFTNQGYWFKSCYYFTLSVISDMLIYCMNIFLYILPLFRHKVVIVEGNYLLLEDGVWKEIPSLFDEKWQVLILPRHICLRILPVDLYRFETCMFRCWKLLLENSFVKIVLVKDNCMLLNHNIQPIINCACFMHVIIVTS